MNYKNNILSIQKDKSIIIPYYNPKIRELTKFVKYSDDLMITERHINNYLIYYKILFTNKVLWYKPVKI